MNTSKNIIGCCPLDCPDTCSWNARVENGRVVKVTGIKEHPITRGVLCAKVNDYETRTYAPDRLLHPLRRTGAKGSGEFERISWDEALETIASRFQAVIETDGPEALLPLYYMGSAGTVQRQALRRLFHGLGASDLHGDVCGASMVVLMEEGHPVGFDPEEMAHSELILLWGINMLTTCHHQWQFVKEARRRGARVIAIDPVRNRTTDQCDEHIAIIPGTDAILATGMAHVMLTEGIANLDYMQAAAEDFEAYHATVMDWPPERVARACGIEPETVEALARKFAAAKPAVIRAGIAPAQTVSGEAYMRSLSALSCLGGHWQLPGGGLFSNDSPEYDEFAAARPDLVHGSPRSIDMSALGAVLTDNDLSPGIKGLMVWCMNPAVTEIDGGRVREGLCRDDLFTVCVEHFMTDTARYADIILPSTTQLEHFDLVGPWGHHYITANNPAIEPLGEAKSHGEIMRMLAPHLGLTGSAYEETDEEIAATALPPGISLDELKSVGWIKSSPPRPDPANVGPKLWFSDEINVPAIGEGLRLLTPKAHYFLNSSFSNMPRHRESQGQQPELQINPQDANERGLSDGQAVTIRNRQAEFRAHLKVTDAVRTGTVSLDGKCWNQPAENGQVANLLTAPIWSAGGQPAYNDTFVEVTSGL